MEKTNLILYISGSSYRTQNAIDSLQSLVSDCGNAIAYQIVDVTEEPEVAEREKVFATPMLVKANPPPQRRIIGDLNDKDLVLSKLDIKLMSK